MKKPFFSILLALAPCIATADESPQFIVTSAQLTPAIPSWVETNDFDGDSEPGMHLNLAAKYHIVKPQQESPQDDQQYAVNENDNWDDWEEDTEDDTPFFVNAQFIGTLRDANGKELPMTEDAANPIKLSDGVLYWNLSTSELPDTMQLKLDGALSFTIIRKGDTTSTPAIALKLTAKDYAWANRNGYTLSLSMNAVEEEDEDEEDAWEEYETEGEEEADFDTVDDSELPAPIPQPADTEKRTNKLMIEADSSLLAAIRSIIIISPDGTEEHILQHELSDEDEPSLSISRKEFNEQNIIINCEELTPQHQYRLELYTNKTTHSYKLHQPLYLNGVPN